MDPGKGERQVMDWSSNVYAEPSALVGIVLVMAGEPGRFEQETFDEGRLAERISLASASYGVASSVGWFKTSRIAGQFLSLHKEALSRVPVWLEHVPPEGDEAWSGEEFFLTTFDSYEAKEARSPYMGESPVEIGTPIRKPLDRNTVQTLIGMRL